MSLLTFINGSPVQDTQHAIAADDRGLQYGDGLFETMLLIDGQLRYFGQHLTRLKLGCEKLSIRYPGDELLQRELAKLTASAGNAVVKLIVTRGSGGRGYRPQPDGMATRILSLHEMSAPYAPDGAGISVRWCTTRLGINPQLAGIKHLNRLEQVMAQNEWQTGIHAEGLMCDLDGNVICATAANLFAVIDATICTPQLDRCGIRGIMRARVIEAAQALMLTVSERPLTASELSQASEVFITNAVRGIVPVIELENRRWSVGPLTRQLARALELW